MSVSGIGPTESNYPANPPPNGAPAFSFVAIYQLSEIAGALGGSSGTAGVKGASGAGGPTDQLYAEMEALTDLAEIHIYLNMRPPDMKDAIAAANNFLSLKSQCNMADPNIAAVYTQAASYFTIDPNSGQVTGFQNDTAGKSFSTWWTSGSSASSGIAGAQYEFDWLGSLQNQSTKLWPSVNPNAYTPGVFVDLCIMYADAMSVPSIAKNNIDLNFWGNHNLGGPFSFGDIFPYAMAAYAYETQGSSGYVQMMQQMETLLNAVIPAPGVNSSYYDIMLKEFGDLTQQLQNDPTWPPTSPVPQLSSAEWAILQQTLSDPSTFYGVILDSMFGQFEYGSP